MPEFSYDHTLSDDISYNLYEGLLHADLGDFTSPLAGGEEQEASVNSITARSNRETTRTDQDVVHFADSVDLTRFYFFDEIPNVVARAGNAKGNTKPLKRKYVKKLKVDAADIFSSKQVASKRKYNKKKELCLKKVLGRKPDNLESDHNYIVEASAINTTLESYDTKMDSENLLENTIILEETDFVPFIEILPTTSKDYIQEESDYILFSDFL